MRSATSCGCSTKLVVESRTPGMVAFPSGSLISSKTRLLDGSVVAAHGRGHRERVRLVGWVVVVLEEVPDHARRGRGHERLGPVHPREGGPQVRDILPDERLALPLDRAGADRTANAD